MPKYFECIQSVKSQIDKLPLHLQFEWYKPCCIKVTKKFFSLASQYITIPHPEYWQDEETTNQGMDI